MGYTITSFALQGIAMTTKLFRDGITWHDDSANWQEKKNQNKQFLSRVLHYDSSLRTVWSGQIENVPSQFLAQQLQLSFSATDYEAKQPLTQYTRFMLTHTFFNDMILFMSSHVHTLLLNGYLRFYRSTKHLRGKYVGYCNFLLQVYLFT